MASERGAAGGGRQGATLGAGGRPQRAHTQHDLPLPGPLLQVRPKYSPAPFLFTAARSLWCLHRLTPPRALWIRFGGVDLRSPPLPHVSAGGRGRALFLRLWVLHRDGLPVALRLARDPQHLEAALRPALRPDPGRHRTTATTRCCLCAAINRCVSCIVRVVRVVRVV